MRKVSAYKALPLTFICLLTAFAQEQPRPLEPGKPVERELSGGQTHVYTVTLSANQIARIIAEQKGIDLMLSALAPDGTKLFEVDSPNGSQGDEAMTIVARQRGVYRIEARAMETALEGVDLAAEDVEGLLVIDERVLSGRLRGIGCSARHRTWSAPRFATRRRGGGGGATRW